jgi:hypothetical protein
VTHGVRTLAPTLLGLLLALSGAASAGQYFQVPETVVVHLSGAPYQPTYVKFTDKGKEAVQNLLKSIKVTVGGKEVQLSAKVGVQAKKVREVKVGELKNEEYVAGALGYEVPDRYFVGYLQFKDNKYVVKYDEHQTPVRKSAPGFGEFYAVAAYVLGQYDENKGLPFIAPSVDPKEHVEEVMLCLPIEADVTLRPAVLQMDWYIYLNEAELGKVYLKYARVHAHKDGDRVHLVYAPSKVDVALVLKDLMPKADEMVDKIVDPYFEEAKKVEEAKLTELLEPVRENLGELVADRILKPFLQGFINKLVLDRVEAEIKGLLRDPVEQALNELAGLYLSVYTSQYPETMDVSVLEARKRARQSVLFEPMVEAEESVIQRNVEAALDQIKDTVEQATQDYVDDIASLVGTSEEDVKKTINRLTVGVLENVINSLWDYVEWLTKLVTLNALASMATSGLLVV